MIGMLCCPPVVISNMLFPGLTDSPIGNHFKYGAQPLILVAQNLQFVRWLVGWLRPIAITFVNTL
jgi:hypothetical protein